MNKLAKLVNYLILALLFLLPWQARWIYSQATLNGRPWEYGTLSFYGTEILLWLIVILTGIRFFARFKFWKKAFSPERFKKRWPYLLFGIVLAFIGGYSVAVSPVEDISLQFLSRLIGILCLSLCLGLASLEFRQMALFFWGGGVVQGFIALWQFVTQEVIANKWLGMAAQLPSGVGVSVVQTETERWLRSYGSFGSPNALGIYLALVLVIGLIIWFEFKDYTKQWLAPIFFGGQMVVFIGLVFSFSRGAWIAAFLGIATCFLIVKLTKIPKEKINAGLYQIVAFILLVAIIGFLYLPIFGTRFGQKTYLENLSIDERLSQAKVAQQIIFSHPFSGIGPGLYTYYLAEHYQAPSYGTYQPAHNTYLLSMAELGLPIFILSVFFIIWIVRMIIKTHPVLMSAVVVLAVAGLFDHFLWSMYVGQLIFWVIFGLGLAKKDLVISSK